MSKAKNILFLMFDQLRWDYLSCYGHPHLHTPNIDRLAAKGVRFTNARIQSPLCGPSRMSTLTGRYVSSHGASWNAFPLKVGEQTMGDHLRKVGMETWLVGKTHMEPDAEGMERLGIDPESPVGKRLTECGFDVWERDDGLNFEGKDPFADTHSAKTYNAWLRERGYESPNPWHEFANSSVDDDGNVLSGWFIENNTKAANIREEDSETPYMMRRGIEFMEHMNAKGDAPWLCHLSLIKPHWPYIVPAPYHAMYGPEHMLPVVRDDAELETDHPVVRTFLNAPTSKGFWRDDVRQAALTGYMGLIKQIDDQVGVLLKYLEDSGRMDDTMIVFTSDHGDFMGDHWMGEKAYFYDSSVKIPLIIYDPSAEADGTRGTVSDALVEQIDFLPTFIDIAGGNPADVDHILEGESLMPLIRGEATQTTRDYIFCEYDYSHTPGGEHLDLHPDDARIMMVCDKKWKMIHFEGGFRPVLFDLENDPDELVDLGNSADHADTIATLYDALNAWARRNAQRTTKSNAAILMRRKRMGPGAGIFLGVYEAGEIPEEFTGAYRRTGVKDHREPS